MKVFLRYKMCNNFKSVKAMKENIRHICRPITSDNFRYWKSNQRKASYGKEKGSIYK